MLRKQLLVRLGVLVLGFVAGAVTAILMLHSVLAELNTTAERAAATFNDVQVLASETAAAEDALTADPARAPQEPLGRIAAAADRLAGQQLMSEGGAGAEVFQQFDEHRRELQQALLQAPANPAGGAAAVAALSRLRTDARLLGEVAARQAAVDQLAVSHDLRVLIIGLSVAALIMANVAVLVLLRTGQLILRPVAALVEGSRLLAAERFDHRVQVDRNDEFGQLAQAYNHLAAELQGHERRRIETLRQLAVTLNHEINNVINVIELQLGLLDRRARGDSVLAAHLLHIREALHRIARTVASLKDLRRIVVTDYVPGQKMLDLARSTEDEPAEPAPASPAPGRDAAQPEIRSRATPLTAAGERPE